MNLKVMALNKQEIIDILKKYAFDKSEYIVLSTGALVMHQIKDKAHDIDLAVSPTLYDKLVEKYNPKCSYKRVIDGVEFKMYSFDVFDFGMSYYDLDNVDFIDGIPVQNVETVLKLKQSLGREKDLEDIKLIEEYCKNNDR